MAIGISHTFKESFEKKFVGIMPVRLQNYFYRVHQISTPAMAELIAVSPGKWWSLSTMYRDMLTIPVPRVIPVVRGARVSDPLTPLLLRLSRDWPAQVWPDSPRTAIWNNVIEPGCNHALVVLNTDGSRMTRANNIMAVTMFLANSVNNIHSPLNMNLLAVYDTAEEGTDRHLFLTILSPLLARLELARHRAYLEWDTHDSEAAPPDTTTTNSQNVNDQVRHYLCGEIGSLLRYSFQEKDPERVENSEHRHSNNIPPPLQYNEQLAPEVSIITSRTKLQLSLQPYRYYGSLWNVAGVSSAVGFLTIAAHGKSFLSMSATAQRCVTGLAAVERVQHTLAGVALGKPRTLCQAIIPYLTLTSSIFGENGQSSWMHFKGGKMSSTGSLGMSLTIMTSRNKWQQSGRR
jgi:hypothetical protein